MRKLYFYLFLVVFGSAVVFAQDSPEKQLKKLEGDVQEIIVKTDKGSVTLKGDDAKKMFKKMKRKSPMAILDHEFDFKEPFLFFDGDSGVFSKTIIINGDTVFLNGKHKPHIDIDSLLKDMKVFKDHNSLKFHWQGEADEEGAEKVVIVTDDDEDVSVETYTGKDAEKKLDELNKDSDEKDKKTKVIILNKKKKDKTN